MILVTACRVYGRPLPDFSPCSLRMSAISGEALKSSRHCSIMLRASGGVRQVSYERFPRSISNSFTVPVLKRILKRMWLSYCVIRTVSTKKRNIRFFSSLVTSGLCQSERKSAAISTKRSRTSWLTTSMAPMLSLSYAAERSS
jgi:hypothetical protein